MTLWLFTNASQLVPAVSRRQETFQKPMWPWPLTLIFNRVLEVVQIHVHAKFHRARCRGSWVIVLMTEKKREKNLNLLKAILPSLPRAVKIRTTAAYLPTVSSIFTVYTSILIHHEGRPNHRFVTFRFVKTLAAEMWKYSIFVLVSAEIWDLRALINCYYISGPKIVRFPTQNVQ